MKKYKLIITVAIFICFCYGNCPNYTFAKEAENNTVLSLSLEESCNMAIENNLNLKIQQIEYEKTKIEQSEAINASKKLKDSTFDFSGAQIKDLTPRMKQAEELVAKTNLELEKQKLRIEVEKAYYDVLLAQENLKYIITQSERAQTQLKNVKLKFEEGLVAQNHVYIAEAETSNVKSNLVTAQKNLEISKIQLNKILGRTLTSPLILTSEFEYHPQFDIEVESMVEKALKLRPEIINAKEMKEVAQLNADLALKYYASNTYIYKKANLEAKKEELRLKDEEEKLSLEVRKAYLTTIEAIEKIKTAEDSVKLAKETHRIANLRYEMQMTTIAEVIEAMEKLKDAENQYLTRVYDYNIARAKLDNWAGKGLE